MSAAMFESLVQNHPFIVGALEQGRLDFERIDRWLREQINEGQADGR